ncbi:unnamed protein product [Durusdinium trenchii]|uniref:PUM-HD domain-containing protein n=1 Tax=Durusdinium trenchii TaxID=1381693 RepID=A0ABP0NUH4_9DINO
MAGSAQPCPRRDERLAKASAGQRKRPPMYPQEPGLVHPDKRNEEERQRLLLNELLESSTATATTPEQNHVTLLRRLMTMPMQDIPVPGGETSQTSSAAFTPARGLEDDESEAFKVAMQAKNWKSVKALIEEPEQVWILACSPSGSRHLQELLKNGEKSSHTAQQQQAAEEWKAAVDKVVSGLQSHVLEATAASGDWNYSNYVLQACIQVLPLKKFIFILEEMKMRIVDVAMNPHGCRVLQRLIEHVLQQETHAQHLMQEMLPEIKRLSKDQYGNHVMQKFLEMASQSQKAALIQAFLRLAEQPGQLSELAMDKYASWVLEKVIREPGAKQLLEKLDLELNWKVSNCDGTLGRKVAKTQFGSFVYRTVLQMKQESPKDVSAASHAVFHFEPRAKAIPMPQEGTPYIIGQAPHVLQTPCMAYPVFYGFMPASMSMRPFAWPCNDPPQGWPNQ